jgi:hypothetical protein
LVIGENLFAIAEAPFGFWNLRSSGRFWLNDPNFAGRQNPPASAALRSA